MNLIIVTNPELGWDLLSAMYHTLEECKKHEEKYVPK